MRLTYIFLSILIVTGLIVTFRAEDRYQWIKAGIIFVVQIICSIINFILLFLVSFILMSNDKYINFGNLFMLLALFILISGILLYWGMRLIGKVIRFSNTTLTLIEYYIQWILIYVTVYQAIFSNLKHIKGLGEYIRVGNFLDPNVIVLTILPSFISAWISIIMYKRYTKAIQSSL